MQVLSVNGMTKSFGEKDIVVDAAFAIYQRDRAGLIGANGSGKSTLMKVLAGVMEPSHGDVDRLADVDIGYLPQIIHFSDNQTVGGWLQEAQQALRSMERRLQQLASQMAEDNESDPLQKTMKEYGELAERFEQRGGYDLPHTIQAVLQGLDLAYLDESQQVAYLSGGEKTRLGLAAILIQSPDVLLLDEPTNHLDFATMNWLEGYLEEFRGTLVVISHDRTFLNKTVNRIFEVDEFDHKVREYTGNYDAYMEEKQRRRKRWEEQFLDEQARIQELRKRINETAHQVAHHRPAKDKNKMAYNGHGQKVQRVVSSRIRAAQVELDRILESPTPRPPESMRFSASLEAEKVHHPTAIAATNLNVQKSNGTLILKNVSFTLGRDEHVLIIGPNGSGKTTLLNIIADTANETLTGHHRELRIEGEVFLPGHAKLGYIRQATRHEFIKQTETSPSDSSYSDSSYVGGGNGEPSLLDTFRQLLPGQQEEHIAKLLSYQLFQFHEFNLPLSSLSPGQHRKLMIAKLLAEKANLLLVDEPTNHVSFDILQEFERALNHFSGPVVVVSHDRWFIKHFQGSIWTLEDGVLKTGATRVLTREDEERMIQEVQELSQYNTE